MTDWKIGKQALKDNIAFKMKFSKVGILSFAFLRYQIG